MSKLMRQITGYVVVLFIIVISAYIYNKEQLEVRTIDNAPESAITIKDISTFSKKLDPELTMNFPEQSIMSNSYGVRLFNRDKQLISNGEIEISAGSTNFYVSMVNSTDYLDTVGLMILIDGRVQTFNVDTNRNAYNVYVTKMDAFSLINVPIELNKIVTDGTTNHTLTVVMIYYFDKLPNDRVKYIDFYTSSMMLNLILTNGITTEIVERKPPGSITYNRTSKTIGNGVQLEIDDLKNSATNSIQIDKTNNVINIKGYASKGKYTSILMVDNAPYKQFDWEMKQDGMEMNYAIEIDDVERYKYNPRSSIYTITIPDRSLPIVFTSTKKILITDK